MKSAASVAKPKKKETGQGLEVILDPGHSFVVTMRLPRHKDSIRGRQAYRKTLRAVIKECQGKLGEFPRV